MPFTKLEGQASKVNFQHYMPKFVSKNLTTMLKITNLNDAAILGIFGYSVPAWPYASQFVV